jgi:hypothetical protein
MALQELAVALVTRTFPRNQQQCALRFYDSSGEIFWAHMNFAHLTKDMQAFANNNKIYLLKENRHTVLKGKRTTKFHLSIN